MRKGEKYLNNVTDTIPDSPQLPVSSADVGAAMKRAGISPETIERLGAETGPTYTELMARLLEKKPYSITGGRPNK